MRPSEAGLIIGARGGVRRRMGGLRQAAQLLILVGLLLLLLGPAWAQQQPGATGRKSTLQSTSIKRGLMGHLKNPISSKTQKRLTLNIFSAIFIVDIIGITVISINNCALRGENISCHIFSAGMYDTPVKRPGRSKTN